MKLHKAGGVDGIESEHLQYAHPCLSSLFCVLFNCILYCEHVPSNFGVGVIIPLIKDKQNDASDINNYRGIPLSPCISKLFEMCTIDYYGHFIV